MPINVMIIIILVLAVLVVVIVLFTKGSSIFAQNVLSCDSKNGQCVEKDKCQYQKTEFTCPRKEQVCCISPAGA